VHRNDIAGLSPQRGGGNALERFGLRAVAGIVPLHRYMIFLAEQGEGGGHGEDNCE
jgi:hypothetical protein